jgi:type I restriction enzyme R subunit
LTLTPADLAALEQMLRESRAGDEADIARAREESHGLGIFIRTLIGLDRQAAAEAFSEHLVDSKYSTTQIRFLELIVEQLTANGVMEAARLYESPFTDHAPLGPDSVFTDQQVESIIRVLDSVRKRAAPENGAA